MEDNLVSSILEQGDTRKKFIPGEDYIPVDDFVTNGDESLNMVEAVLGSKKDFLPSLVSKFFHYMGGTNINVVGNQMAAHLLIMKALSSPVLGSRGIYAGDEIITTGNNINIINSARMCGVIPVIVDIDLATMLPDPIEVETAIEEGKTKAIFLTSPCGNPIQGEKFREIADEFGVMLIEDVGYGIGGMISEIPAAKFSDIAIFSFHSNVLGSASVIVSKASLVHDIINKACNSDDPSPLSIGLGTNSIMLGFIDAQMDKLDYSNKMRGQNWNRLEKGLKKHKRWLRFQTNTPLSSPAWSAFAVIIKEPYEHLFTKEELMLFLEEHKIGCRSLVGNVLSVDGYKESEYRQVGELMTSNYIHKNTILIGCHPNMLEEHTNYIINIFDKFMERVEE